LRFAKFTIKPTWNVWPGYRSSEERIEIEEEKMKGYWERKDFGRLKPCEFSDRRQAFASLLRKCFNFQVEDLNVVNTQRLTLLSV